MAIKTGRRFVGCELKGEYFDQGVKNLSAAMLQLDIFTGEMDA
jgi:hypothetical protein